ncbi:MAG TPA: hypothetical protein VN758_08110 [Solirubrobacterales bacterium]|nr:hypothetical protein [Solirubrobacterales bacterium]
MTSARTLAPRHGRQRECRVTPESVRLRKVELDKLKRQKAARTAGRGR